MEEKKGNSYRDLPEEEKNELLSNLTKENLLLKNIIMEIDRNKDFVIQKEDSENKKVEIWKIGFKDNTGNYTHKGSVFFIKKGNYE